MTDEEFEPNLIQVVKTLLAWRGVTVETLAKEIGLGSSTAYQRLGPFKVKDRVMPPTTFSALEVWKMAGFFRVDVCIFFRPVESLIA